MLRMMRLLVATLVFFAAGSLGCDKGGGGQQQGGASGSPEKVRLGYFPNVTHAQAVLGVASGDYQKAVAPAELETRIFNAGPLMIEALFAGEIDVGYIGPQPALTGHGQSRGKGVRVIAGSAANGVLIVASPGSGINTLADLAGKKVATPQHGNTQDIAARHYLTTELNQDDADNVRPMPNAEQQGMMRRGEVDAAWAPEPWGSFLVSQAGAKVIAREKDLWRQGRFATVVVITTPEFLARHPGVVEKLLAAHRDWTRRLRDEPEKYAPELESALFDLTGKAMPPGVIRSAFGNTLFSDDPMPYTFETLARWAYDLGFTRKPTDTAGLIDTTILDRLKATPGATQPTSTIGNGEPSKGPYEVTPEVKPEQKPADAPAGEGSK